jgi:hypothetical protein
MQEARRPSAYCMRVKRLTLERSAFKSEIENHIESIGIAQT